MTAPIEVLRIHRLHGGGSVKAFVDLRLGGLSIFGAKIVQQEGQRAWVGMPSQKSADGKWRLIVAVDSKPLRERISAVVLDAWGRHEVQVIPPKARGQGAWDAVRAATAEPAMTSAEQPSLGTSADTTSARSAKRHAEALAAEFDRQGPDDVDDL
jgi:DNA-binding cell septation regulator SpoVG